jgi:hypothetical protein
MPKQGKCLWQWVEIQDVAHSVCNCAIAVQFLKTTLEHGLKSTNAARASTLCCMYPFSSITSVLTSCLQRSTGALEQKHTTGNPLFTHRQLNHMHPAEMTRARGVHVCPTQSPHKITQGLTGCSPPARLTWTAQQVLWKLAIPPQVQVTAPWCPQRRRTGTPPRPASSPPPAQPQLLTQRSSEFHGLS